MTRKILEIGRIVSGVVLIAFGIAAILAVAVLHRRPATADAGAPAKLDPTPTTR